jgi:hypothetical protein
VSELRFNKVRVEESVSLEGGFTFIAANSPDGMAAGGFSIMQEIASPVFIHYPHGAALPMMHTPSFTMNRATCQTLLDALWEKGVRPSSGVQAGADPKGQIEAMSNHLADLRGILKRVVPPAKTGDTPTEGGTQSW